MRSRHRPSSARRPRVRGPLVQTVPSIGQGAAHELRLALEPLHQRGCRQAASPRQRCKVRALGPRSCTSLEPLRTSASPSVLGRGILTPVYNRLCVYIYSTPVWRWAHWSEKVHVPGRKVALVAGGTRGAGRGIAVELGAAGATVYVTGRTTRTGNPSMRARKPSRRRQRSYRRPAAASPSGSIISLPTRCGSWSNGSAPSRVASMSSSMISGAGRTSRVGQARLGA